MKRLQILLDEDLDDELERLALRLGRSKSALMRDFVRAGVAPQTPFEEDPLTLMDGSDDFAPGNVDEVVYR